MINTKNQRKSFLKTILKFCETVIGILIILVCAMILIQRISNNHKSLFGYRLFRVETGSMIPKYNINDVLLVKEIDTRDIVVGDDVTYTGNIAPYKGMIITHQVIEKKTDGDKIKFTTKGIANSSADPEITEDQVIGKVLMEVGILSLITNLLTNIYTLYFLIVLPFILSIFFMEVRSTERRERFIERRIKEEQEELERQRKKEQKTALVKKKRGQLIVNTDSKTKRANNSKNKKTKS